MIFAFCFSDRRWAGSNDNKSTLIAVSFREGKRNHFQFSPDTERRKENIQIRANSEESPKFAFLVISVFFSELSEFFLFLFWGIK